MPSDRYQAQEKWRFWGPEGQDKLRRARVLIVGCGGLGGHQANLLARAGVGFLRLIDADQPDLGNLHRQILFDETDLDSPDGKAIIAAERLRWVNSEISIEGVEARFSAANADSWIKDVDLVLDASDNFPTRFALNRACVALKKPWIYGGVVGATGMVLNIFPGVGPCLQCLYPEEPPADQIPTSQNTGIVNTAPAIIAALQVNEAFKILLGDPAVTRELVQIDLWQLSFAATRITRSEQCPVCGKL